MDGQEVGMVCLYVTAFSDNTTTVRSVVESWPCQNSDSFHTSYSMS